MEGDFDSECRGGEEVYKVRVNSLAFGSFRYFTFGEVQKSMLSAESSLYFLR